MNTQTFSKIDVVLATNYELGLEWEWAFQLYLRRFIKITQVTHTQTICSGSPLHLFPQRINQKRLMSVQSELDMGSLFTLVLLNNN